MSKIKVSRNLWLTLAALAICFSAHTSARAQACPVAGTTVTGSITTADPTQTDRIFRDGTPSDCNGKASPGTLGSGVYHYDQYTFPNNSGAAACIQISFSATTNMHSVAYLNSFNPANIEQNYLGDLGVVNTPNTTESYSVNVPNGATLVVVVNEATVNGGGDYSLTLSCITAPPPLPTAPGQILISEFRLSGPAAGAGSQRDEFIELYNNTDVARTIDRLLLRAYDPNFNGPGDGADFVQALPAGTVIPARGHYLVGDSGAYSLSSYASLDFDTSTVFAGDFFIDNEGIQILSNDGLIVYDSIGVSGSGGRPGEEVSYTEGTPLPRRTQTAPTVQYAYVRKITTGLPQDTNNNANDFTLVSVTGTTFPLAVGGTTQSTLGAPGPESIASPIQRNATIKASFVDPSCPGSGPPSSACARARDMTPVTNGAQGTLEIRRRFTNVTGAPITRLRFRVVDITTLNSPGYTPGGPQADVRALTSSGRGFSGPILLGLTLEEPPTQAQGGGHNATLSAGIITMAQPLLNGDSLNFIFSLGVQQAGSYRFFVNTEATLGAPTVAAPGQHTNKGALAQKAGSRVNAQSAPSTRSATNSTPLKSDVLRTWPAMMQHRE